jgi:ribose 5-phosphate isomerase A
LRPGIDFRKLQSHLLTAWPSIPIEVAPIAAPSVLTALKALGSTEPKIRSNPLVKSGPLKTDQDFYIIDAPFPKPLLTDADLAAGGHGKGDGSDGTWAVQALADAINGITGVLEVGIFSGLDGIKATELGQEGKGQKPVQVYFGMEDGSVEVRTRTEGLPKST